MPYRSIPIISCVTNSSTFRKMRIYYLNNRKKCLFILLLFFISYISFFTNIISSSKPSLLVRYSAEDEEDTKWMSDSEVQAYLDTLQDTRPTKCLDQAYDFTRMFDVRETVSIITTYFGKQSVGHFKLSITSLVDHTPYDIYEEIIVIDDGTKDAVYQQKTSQFLSQPKFHKVKLFRSEDHEGEANARFKGVLVAKGTIIVFVSPDVIVNHAWIQPLVAKVATEETTIAVPHYDNMLSGHRFYKTDDSLVNTFSWSMYTVAYESGMDRKEEEFLHTSVMRGEVMAVKKSFLMKIGNYDENIEADGGGESLELSLRAWMCGGKITLAKCSRVAVHSSMKPLSITSKQNFQRIAELWFGDFKDIAYKQASISDRLSEESLKGIKYRKDFFQQNKLQCKDMAWYLENVAKEVIAPSDNFVFFGKLKAKTAFCLRMRTEVDVEMVLCRHHVYEPLMMFEMNSYGFIFKDSSCLTVDSSGQDTGVVNKAVLAACQDGTEDQMWNLQDDHLVLASIPTLCLTQANNRDEKTGELVHYAQLMKCESGEARNQTWEFINY